MEISRRRFLAGAGVAATGLVRPGRLLGQGPEAVQGPRNGEAVPASGAGMWDTQDPGSEQDRSPTDRFDPWIEVDARALAFNVGVVSRLVQGRPILAVIKNNAYGLGLAAVGRILEGFPEVAGLAVVKTDAALALREAGVRKPVLLMALFGEEDGPELVARDVHLCLTTDDAAERVARAVSRAGKPARTHVYLDTGMSRMGIPFHRALPWLEDLQARGVRVESAFTAFTEDPEYDPIQLQRFLEVVEGARALGLDLGTLHAASSAAVFNFPDAHLDMVRPGIALFGAYPSNEGKEAEIAGLRPAGTLRARVVRVERLRPGDSVSYGREYVANEPTWVATLPVGHSDGYPREAVEGARVLIDGRLYPPVGAVSASHTIVEVGEREAVRIGDVATLVGPEHPEIHPNTVATRTGRSVYDILMHLSGELPRVVV
jgi:alanine racemase